MVRAAHPPATATIRLESRSRGQSPPRPSWAFRIPPMSTIAVNRTPRYRFGCFSAGRRSPAPRGAATRNVAARFTPRGGFAATYPNLHDDLDLITAYLVADESFDPSSWDSNLLSRANGQLWRLCQDEDVDYRSAAIGRMYASWYHLRRVRGAFEVLKHRSRSLGPITVLDLGCGTGAAAWALAMHGISATYIGVDSSPSMLTWAKGLWETFCTDGPVPAAARDIEARWVQGDAIDSLCDGSLGDEADLVLMPFLLDDRFMIRLHEQATRWRACIEHLGASVLVWSSPQKIAAARRAMGEIMGTGGSSVWVDAWSAPDLACPRLAEARRTLQHATGVSLNDRHPVNASIKDTAALAFFPIADCAPANPISKVAPRLDRTSAELLALCQELGFEQAFQRLGDQQVDRLVLCGHRWIP